MTWNKLILCVLVAVLGILYAQSYFDAQCMKLDFAGAHLTVEGVFCKRQMGKTLMDYKLLDECIRERIEFERRNAAPVVKWMMG